jgi:hypothetical protein
VIERFLPVRAEVTREDAHRWRVAWTTR